MKTICKKLLIPFIFAILLTACEYSGSLMVNETPVYVNASGRMPEEIAFGGKVVNSTTGQWPNDRLVLLFLKSKEISRSITATGEFTGALDDEEPTQTPFGVVDGLFLLRAPNIYELTPDLLVQDRIPLVFRRAYFPTEANGFGPLTMYTWFDQIEEGSTYKLYIPSKNVIYTIMVFNGDVNDLPSNLLVKGSTELLDNGEIVVKLPNTNLQVDIQELSNTSVQNIEYSNQTEEVEINRLTIPLDNCGGSVDLSQKYSYTQTFIHEYTTELGFNIGAEIPVSVWAKILGQIQTKYGFLNGQIDTKTIEYNMAASPGTSVVYYITWKEIWETGSGNVSITDKAVNVPFRVKTNVVYEVLSEARACP